MKVTIEANSVGEVISLLTALANKGLDMQEIKDSCRKAANEAAASAAKADAAARNVGILTAQIQ